MQFVLLINGDEAAASKMSQEDGAKMFAAYKKYTDELVAAGVMRGGAPLESTQKSAKVRVRAGKRTVVDGPFTEAKEVCGGYYSIEVPSLKEAIEWAAKCPGAEYGTMEVRPIMPVAM